MQENLLEGIFRSLKNNAVLAVIIVGLSVAASFALSNFFPTIYENKVYLRIMTGDSASHDSKVASLMQAFVAEKDSLKYLQEATGLTVEELQNSSFALFDDAGSGLVRLRVRHHNPQFLDQLATAVTEVLSDGFFDYSAEVREFEYMTAKSRLVHIENTLSDARNQLLSLKTQRHGEREESLAEVEQEIHATEERISIAQRQLESIPKESLVYEEQQTAQYKSLESQLEKERDNLAELLRRYRQRHPRVIETNARVESLETKLREAVQTVRRRRRNPEYTRINNQLERDIRAITALRTKYRTLSEGTGDQNIAVNNLKLRIATLKELHKQTLVKLEDTRFAQGSSKRKITLLNRDSHSIRVVGLTSVQRDGIVILSGILAAVFLLYSPKPVRTEIVGISPEMLSEIMEKSNSLRLTSEPTESILQVPSLCAEALALPAPENEEQESALIYDERLIALNDPESPALAPFKNLVSNLLISIAESQNRIVLAGSARSGKGRTTLLANTAILMAKAGYSVLMIDANYRNPSLHKILDLENNKGFSDALKGERSQDLLQVTTVENLTLMSSGMVISNPARVFGSPALIEVLSDLRRKFELILIDTPALLDYPETSVLMGQTGAVVFVNPEGEPKEDLQAARKVLKSVGARVFGYVKI